MLPTWNFNLNQTNAHYKECHSNSIFIIYDLIIVSRFAHISAGAHNGNGGDVLHYFHNSWILNTTWSTFAIIHHHSKNKKHVASSIKKKKKSHPPSFLSDMLRIKLILRQNLLDRAENPLAGRPSLDLLQIKFLSIRSLLTQWLNHIRESHLK